jgi:2-polyprenyl-3-methyl-5-hydroxy-6-metoxy-1,4-benzoquinol methylase
LLLDDLEPHLKPDARCLDFGAGDGHLVKLMVERGYRTAAFEPSPQRAAQIHKTVGTNRHFLGIVDESCCEQYDVVIMAEVIEHLLHEDIDSTFALIRRFMADDARLIVTTPNNENLDQSLVYCPLSDVVFHRWQHMRAFTPTSLDTELSRHGFQRVELGVTDFSSNRALIEKAKQVGKEREDMKDFLQTALTSQTETMNLIIAAEKKWWNEIKRNLAGIMEPYHNLIGRQHLAIQEQNALVENQREFLKQQNSVIGEQLDLLKQQRIVIENQVMLLQQQRIAAEGHRDLLLQQHRVIDDQQSMLQEQRSLNADFRHEQQSLLREQRNLNGDFRDKQQSLLQEQRNLNVDFRGNAALFCDILEFQRNLLAKEIDIRKKGIVEKLASLFRREPETAEIPRLHFTASSGRALENSASTATGSMVRPVVASERNSTPPSGSDEPPGASSPTPPESGVSQEKSPQVGRSAAPEPDSTPPAATLESSIEFAEAQMGRLTHFQQGSIATPPSHSRGPDGDNVAASPPAASAPVKLTWPSVDTAALNDINERFSSKLKEFIHTIKGLQPSSENGCDWALGAETTILYIGRKRE